MQKACIKITERPVCTQNRSRDLFVLFCTKDGVFAFIYHRNSDALKSSAKILNPNMQLIDNQAETWQHEKIVTVLSLNWVTEITNIRHPTITVSMPTCSHCCMSPQNALLLSVNCCKLDHKGHLCSDNFHQHPPNDTLVTTIYRISSLSFKLMTHVGPLRPAMLLQSSVSRQSDSSCTVFTPVLQEVDQLISCHSHQKDAF